MLQISLTILFIFEVQYWICDSRVDWGGCVMGGLCKGMGGVMGGVWKV